MKLKKRLVIGFLLVISVAAATAQNTLPNPNDDGCWSSLGALRACQLRAYNAAEDYDRRCSSYPEYQCAPRDEQKSPEQAAAKPDKNKGSQSTKPRRPGLKSRVPADAETRTASAK